MSSSKTYSNWLGTPEVDNKAEGESHRERLNEWARKGCDSLNFGITKEAEEGTRSGTPLMKVSSNKMSKVQYVDVKHEEADIAFAGIRIHAPYGPITVIPDRSCPAQTAYLLSLDTWKLRSTGKVPHILKYGMEGLEGLRVGTADALEVRIGKHSCPAEEQSLAA